MVALPVWSVVGGGGGKTAAALLGERDAIFDFENGDFFWNGAARSVDDLTVGTADRYYIDGLTGITDQWTIMVEYNSSAAAGGDEVLLTLDDGDFGTRRLAMYQDNSSRLTYSYFASAFVASANNLTATTRGLRHRRRAIFSARAGAAPIFYQDGNIPGPPSPATAATELSASRISFEGWQGSGQTNFTGDLHKVSLWNSALSGAQCQTLLRGDNLPIHFIGDSFLGDLVVAGYVMEPLNAVFRCFSHDGIGSTTLTQQAARWLSDWKHARDATLIIGEGGLDYAGVDGVARIADMVDSLTHHRWLWVEPCRDDGMIPDSESRIAFDALLGAIRTAYPNNEVPTFDALAAGWDESTEDGEDIADGFCPRSLRIDGIHLNDAGAQIWAAQIQAAIAARGW